MERPGELEVHRGALPQHDEEEKVSNGDRVARRLRWLGLGLMATAVAARLAGRKSASTAAGVGSVLAFGALGGERMRAAKRSPVRSTIIRAVTVNRPVHEVYRFWRDLENLPRFMRHLEAVEVTDQRRSHWTAKGPAGRKLEWDAEIVEDQPNESIAWRSLGGGAIDHIGRVLFAPAPGGRGTEVRVEMHQEYPPGGQLAETVAKLFRQAPEQKIQDDLRAFKQVMETGEVVRSDTSVVKGRKPARPPLIPARA